jgi:NAD(P)-dependent dehydrogenase (short-subunit alcohol dehydrogenase family)
MGEDLDVLTAQALAGRPAEAREIAEMSACLAGDAASFVQGAVLPADGGRTAV